MHTPPQHVAGQNEAARHTHLVRTCMDCTSDGAGPQDGTHGPSLICAAFRGNLLLKYTEAAVCVQSEAALQAQREALRAQEKQVCSQLSECHHRLTADFQVCS